MRMLIAILVTCLAVGPALADATVERAQELLISLGYKLGTPDGVAGKKTEAAMGEVMARYGMAYDGAISQNELDLLIRVAPNRIPVDFKIDITELNFLDAADINGDGRMEFVVTAMPNTFEQLGIECCFVPADRVAEIISPIPLLVYSTAEGYNVIAFPEEAKGNRSQAGRFFATAAGQYFVLAKNGEMGLPVDNHGEISMVFSMAPGPETVSIEAVASYDDRATSANVEVVDINADGNPEIYLNNYGQLSSDSQRGGSSIRTFMPDETLAETPYKLPLARQQPINFAYLEDFDHSGELDVFIAAEVEKSLDGKQFLAKRAGSYVILDPFNRKTTAKDRIYLDPPHFGNDQAGFSVMPITVDDRTFFFESAQQFLGHMAGAFVYDNLDVYEFDAAGKSVTLVTDEVLPKVSAVKDKAGGFYLKRADIDFDGTDEIYRIMYAGKPQYYDWNGKAFALKDFPGKDYLRPDYLGIVVYLTDAELKCSRSLTMPQHAKSGQSAVDVQISACLPLDMS